MMSPYLCREKRQPIKAALADARQGSLEAPWAGCFAPMLAELLLSLCTASVSGA